MPCLNRSARSKLRSKVIAPPTLAICGLAIHGRSSLRTASNLCPHSPGQSTSVASETTHGPQPNCPLSSTCCPFQASALTSIITSGTGTAYPWSRLAEIGQKLPLVKSPTWFGSAAADAIQGTARASTILSRCEARTIMSRASSAVISTRRCEAGFL